MYIGIALVFALLLLGYLVYQIAVVILVILLTLLFSIIISGPVDFLQKRGLGRGWGTAAAFGGIIVVLGLLGLLIVPVIETQAQEFADTIPTLLSDVQSVAQSLRSSLGLNLSIPLEPQAMLDQARNFLSGGTLSTVAGFGASVANVLSLGAVVLIATIYSVLRPRPLVEGFVSLFPAGGRHATREVLYAMYDTVQRWFLGQLTSMLIIGVLWTIGLFIIGIPFALLLGIFSGLVSFVPYIGPTIAVIPPVLLALVQDPILAVWVVVVYLGIQTVESYMIQPIVMSRAVELHPAVVIFAILIMGTLFGLVGVLLAVPLTAALHVLLRKVWTSRMDTLGVDPDPPENEALHESGRMTPRFTAWLRRAAKFLRRS